MSFGQPGDRVPMCDGAVAGAATRGAGTLLPVLGLATDPEVVRRSSRGTGSSPLVCVDSRVLARVNTWPHRIAHRLHRPAELRQRQHDQGRLGDRHIGVAFAVHDEPLHVDPVGRRQRRNVLEQGVVALEVPVQPRPVRSVTSSSRRRLDGDTRRDHRACDWGDIA